VCASSPNGYSVIVFPCAIKVTDTMETTREVQAKRVALYVALATYLEKLFLEKDREHYTSKKWWHAILIEYPKRSIIIGLLLMIYFLFRTNPEYDTTVIIVLSVIPLAYWVLLFLGG